MRFTRWTSRRSRGRKALLALGAAALTATVIVPMGALASHSEASLAGSAFEIDVNANLKRDDPSPSIDWASVDETRKNDLTTGKDDDSYSGGAKEDITCSSTTTGSIPNNKSDLLTFGVYQEPASTGPGFLHLFWTRVAEPSGTTVMDFELNKSKTDCGNGVNKNRTPGDLLIEYLIEDGGADATIMVREWTGTAWGSAQDLTNMNPVVATGTINSSPIPADDSDGLGAMASRTFGELSLDLNFLLDPTKCESFGSAFLKSRASTSFSSQLKDFIMPVSTTVSNCAKVFIRKETTPDENPNTTTFGFTKSFNTDPSTTNTFTLKDDQAQSYTSVLPGTNYTIVEDVVPTGWSLDSISCAASAGVTPSVNQATATVTFGIDSPSDVLDCTYTNKANGAILITKTRKHADSLTGTLPHAGVTFAVTGGSLAPGTSVTTDTQGKACIAGLVLGNYTVTETVPAGYMSDDAEKTVSVTQAGTCTSGAQAQVSFENTPLTDITVSVNSQIVGGTASKISCALGTTSLASNPADGTPTAFNDTSETYQDLLPGTYNCTVVIDP